MEQGDHTQGISRVHSKVNTQTKAKRGDRTKNEKAGTNESNNYAQITGFYNYYSTKTQPLTIA